MRRIVLQITGIPAPYRMPLYRHAVAELNELGFDFHVFFTGISKIRREWVITEEELSGISYTTFGSTKAALLRDVIAAIKTLNPAAVILGWAMDPIALALLAYCRTNGIPCLIWTGENRNSLMHRSRVWLRKLIRIPFFRLASGFVTYGTAAAEYVCSNHVPPERTFIAINVVDTSYYRSRVDTLRADGSAVSDRNAYRASDGSEFSCHVMYVGFLIRDKGVFETIRAFKQLGRTDACLHVIGSGKQEQALKDLADELGIGSQVFFHGYRQREDVSRFYAMCDVVLFPSLPNMSEVFGLVMVEAAAAGLPVIASQYAGGTVDVVQDGVNGLVIDPLNIAEYAAAMRRLADDPLLRERMGKASRQRSLEVLNVERSASGYMQAIRFALGLPLDDSYTPPSIKPRLLLIGPLPPPYIGPAVATERLLRSGVLASGYDIRFLNVNDPDGLEDIGRLNWHNIETALRHGWQCWTMLLRDRPSALYIPIDRGLWGFLRDLLFILPARVLRVPVVNHLRAGRHDLQHDFGPLGRFIARFGLTGISRTIVLGETVRNVFGTMIPQDRIRVVPNGMQLDGWNADAWSAGREGRKGIRIAYIANLYRDKGAHVMLRAMPEILRRVPDLHITFAGKWMDEQFRVECMELVRTLSLDTHVTFPGPVDDAGKRALLADADIAVFVPVKPEGLPWVILEAMSSALPVIGSPQGTMKEVIIHGETGYLIPSDDSQALAERVIELAIDPALRQQLGTNGRRRVEQVYEERVTHRALADVIGEVVTIDKAG